MPRSNLRWGIGLIWILGVAQAGADPLPLLPPTPRALPLTSTFGEYREGHYHGGLDFSTGGKEGVPVLAPQDGWVFRVRASGIGYGRAVYFRLDDGRTVLYAHLSRFHPRIQRRVETEQDRRQRYEVDFKPEPGAIPFSAGDILGYSGQTGAGPPHLHAEIRVGSEAAVAVNPQTLGWASADSVSPRITRVRVEPAEPGVLVNKGVDPVLISDSDPDPGVEISGPVRIWVECNDWAAPGSYRLAPHVVRGSFDGDVWSEVRLDRFHWNWAREVEWTYHSERARSVNERWISLQPPPKSRQEINRGDGFPALEPGTHRLKIEAVDGVGNRDEFTMEVELALRTGDRASRVEGLSDRLTSRVSFLEFRVAGEERTTLVSIDPDGRRWETGWTTLSAPGGWIHQLGSPQPSVSGLWRFLMRRGDEEIPVGRAVWAGGDGDSVLVVALQGMDIHLEAGSTYGSQWILMDPDHLKTPVTPNPGSPELSVAGPTVSLGPWAWPLRERVRVELFPPHGEPRRGLAVYRRTRRGWSFEGADTTGDGVAAKIGNLGDLALFRDETPPRVRRVETPKTGDREIVAHISDDGVGVHWRGIEMLLDGRTVVAEWDPEAGRLTGYLRRPLEPGEHDVVIQATDRVGNRSRKRIDVTLPE